jgi:RNA polymerase subunit RPABC4/transcription elongation factor Spt4
MAVCAYCKDSIDEEDACYCPSCDASHHQECWTANLDTCSVFGCEYKQEGEEILMGCPYCEETYPAGQKVCNTCGTPSMTPREFAGFLDRYEWAKLPTENDWNPVLTAGFLRNQGILARVSKKVPISMFGFSGGASVWVPVEQVTAALNLIENLADRFRSCDTCGHILFIDETECSYCSEHSGEEE